MAEADASARADVLLVEDNPGDVRLVREAFEEGPIPARMHVVTDGDEALAFLRRRDGHADAPRPDVVLLDLNLPRTNGFEVLEALSTTPELACIPVVVLTSSATEEDVDRAYALDANAYVTKPVDPDAFIDAIQSVQAFWLDAARLPHGRREEEAG